MLLNLVVSPNFLPLVPLAYWLVAYLLVVYLLVAYLLIAYLLVAYWLVALLGGGASLLLRTWRFIVLEGRPPWLPPIGSSFLQALTSALEFHYLWR